MSEACDCGRPVLPHDHFCKECREEFDHYISKEMVREAIEEREALEEMTSQDLFSQLAPEIRQTIRAVGGGYRTIYPEEIFFPSKELAQEWAEENEKGGGYIVSIIVVLTLPDGQRIGLTTTAQHDRAQQQASAYIAAHSACEASHGVMSKCWEVGFLSTS